MYIHTTTGAAICFTAIEQVTVQAPKEAKAASGTDGRYRMLVQDRYTHQATYRLFARYSLPLWFLFGILKLCWTLSPMLVEQGIHWQKAYAIAFILLLSMVLYKISGFGGPQERFAFVMVFNVVTVVSLGLVRTESPLHIAYE